MVALLLAVMLQGCSNKSEAITAPTNAAATTSPFISASTVTQIQSQLRKLPTDEIWWAVNGDDMAWNFRNLHQIFPTVNVYRIGPVRPLVERPMPEIAAFIVDTPTGPMTFESFIGGIKVLQTTLLVVSLPILVVGVVMSVSLLKSLGEDYPVTKNLVD